MNDPEPIETVVVEDVDGADGPPIEPDPIDPEEKARREQELQRLGEQAF